MSHHPQRALGLLIGITLTLSACATGPELDLTIHESDGGAVYVERIPDRSFRAAHPITLHDGARERSDQKCDRGAPARSEHWSKLGAVPPCPLTESQKSPSACFVHVVYSVCLVSLVALTNQITRQTRVVSDVRTTECLPRHNSSPAAY